MNCLLGEGFCCAGLFLGMKRLGSCFFSGLRNGLALPNSGACGADFGWAASCASSPSRCLGDGDCILALMLASGGRSGFCGERYRPEDVRLGSRSFTILDLTPSEEDGA